MVHLPHDSYFYSEDVTPPPVDVSDVIPLPTAPRLSGLSSGNPITIQLMPPYLSTRVGQRLKEYLVLESNIASLIIAVITALLLSVFSEGK
jgi:hypothetical protein